MEEKNLELRKDANVAFPAYDLTKEIPDLNKAVVLPADLTSEYWTPELEGEYKNVFYQEVKQSTYTDDNTGESIELPCVVMVEQTANGTLKTFRNGSKRLVASIEEAVTQGKILQGTPLRIVYLGKKKNDTNAYLSDRWSIKPLIIP